MSHVANLIRGITSKGPPVPYTSSPFIFDLGLAATGNTAAYLEAYGQIGWLFAAVSRIASGIGETQWQLYSGAGDDRQEVEAHPFLDLMARPNEFYTGQDLIEVVQAQWELTGNAFLVANRTRMGRIVELWPVLPQYMRVVPSRDRFIAGYIYDRGTVKEALDVEQVIWLRYHDPKNLYGAMGAVQAAAVDLDTELYASKWNKNFFVNSARPDAVLESERSLNDVEYERLKSEWATNHQGVDRAHRVGILEAGLSYKQISLSQNEMGFIEQRRLTRDAILGVFGIPRSILGITEDVNRANAESAEYTFARWVLLPRIRRWQRMLQRYVLPSFGSGLELDFADPTPENVEAKRMTAEAGARTGSLMVDELRGLLGFDALPDGKGQVFFIPFSMTPKKLDEYGEPQEPPAQLTPFVPGNRGGEEQAPDQELPEQRSKALSASAKDAFANVIVRRMVDSEPKVQALMMRYWRGQSRRAITQVRRNKAVGIPDIFWEQEELALATAMTPLLRAILVSAAEDAITGLNLGIAFDVTNPIVNEWIGDRLRRFSKLVTGSTIDDVVKQLKQGELAGESIAQMTERIKEYYGGIDYRAERVARTEVVSAANRGALESYRQAGWSAKQWWTTLDDRTRPDHMAAHGQLRGINDAFDVGGEQMLHPGGGVIPENNIQCRCVVIPANMI